MSSKMLKEIFKFVVESQLYKETCYPDKENIQNYFETLTYMHLGICQFN